MALNFLPSTNYTDPKAAWDAMVGAADFWDNISEDGNTVTVDGLTLVYNGTLHEIEASGYGLTGTVKFYNGNSVVIAATESALLFRIRTTANAMGVLVLDKNSAGEWSVAEIPFSSTANTMFIAPETTISELALGNVNIVGATLTQLAPATGMNSTWVMEHVYLVLTSPNTSYTGKMELNGEKYVMAGRAAIAYTD